MKKILIKKNGWIEKDHKAFKGDPLELLGHIVTLEEGFCLSSFFGMVLQYPKVKVISELFDAIIQMIPDQDPALLKTDEISGLSFYKTIEITGFPGPPAITIYNSLKGVADNELKDLKFYHLESLLGHHLSFGQLKHIVFGDQQDEFRYDTVYTLFELLEGIAWELSFNFNPLQCSIRR